MTSVIGAFNNLLIRFFEDLYDTFPEERDIKSALEMIKFAKASSPIIIIKMFDIYVYKPLYEPIKREDSDYIITYAKATIENQFNEISPALLIFHKYWETLSDTNKSSIWKYLQKLCELCKIYIEPKA